jgi:diguanylate cyclase (GGDEF)-like protein
LATASVVGFALVYATVLEVRGGDLFAVAHLLYLVTAILALATGPWVGALGGVFGAVLFDVAIVLNPSIPANNFFTTGGVIRVVSFVSIGVIVGWYARKNRRLEADLRRLTEIDHLTGIKNARGFEAALNGRLAVGRPFALLLGDVDGLKLVNDRHGHAAGDRMLKNLAQTLSGALEPGDELARIGGDEFALLVSVATPTDALQFAERYEQVAAAQGCGLTIGWGVYPNDAADAVALTMTADSRLYGRKAERYVDSGAQGTVVPITRLLGDASFSS